MKDQVIYMSYLEARAVKESLKKLRPEYAEHLRVVEYGKGHAVQWYESGVYWPELPEDDPDRMFDPIPGSEEKKVNPFAAPLSEFSKMIHRKYGPDAVDNLYNLPATEREDWEELIAKYNQWDICHNEW